MSGEPFILCIQRLTFIKRFIVRLLPDMISEAQSQELQQALIAYQQTTTDHLNTMERSYPVREAIKYVASPDLRAAVQEWDCLRERYASPCANRDAGLAQIVREMKKCELNAVRQAKHALAESSPLPRSEPIVLIAAEDAEASQHLRILADRFTAPLVLS